MTDPWRPSESRRLSKMLFQAAFLLCLVTFTTSLSGPLHPDILNDAERYRQLRLEHMRRHRRQQPKEISIQVTAPLFSSRLFDYGADSGDKELPAGLDVGKKVDLKYPINFDSGTYQSIFVLSNGGIGFDTNSRTYRSNIFSKDSNSLPLIAPFWNRNDLRNGGHVWYREITSGRILERGQSEIRYQYDKNVKVVSCFLVTWEKMQPLGNQILPDENTNTFQAAFFITANHTYINFIYSNIGWTQGAEAGFVAGPHGNHFSLPTSGTGNIMYLEEYGNTGIPGEWMFELQPHRVIRCKVGIKGDTCDEECSHGEYGEDCAQCCHCAGGADCNRITGQCPNDTCADCWFGPTCHSKNAVCDEQERNSCVRNAVAYFSVNNCNEQIVECNCLQGYEGDGKVECVDIDECLQPGICHENAICTNTPGHFLCQCQEGYTGDGVTECVASFLFPYENHQELPRSRNAKVSFNLRNPLLIFGEPRNTLTVSNSGLILVQEMKKVRAKDRLEDMNVLGIAPFFGPIDLSKGGRVTIAENTDEDVLTRASNQINENLEQPNFKATSAVIVTYANVSTLDSRSSNTFQSVIIGGRNKRGDDLTFTMLLYKDLIWSAGAEAGIMTIEKTNSIHLPGSGTEGIEQLSQLSNVRSPGTWLYRIDQTTIFPCMQIELQPPYCDAQSPTLVNHKQQVTPSTRVKTQEKLSHASSEVVKITSSAEQHLPDERQKTVSPSTNGKPSQVTSGSSVRTRPSTAQQSTEHRPIVSIHPNDFDLPEDIFDVTFPPFVTVVPEIFTPEQKKRPPVGSVEISERPTPPEPPTAPETFRVPEIPSTGITSSSRKTSKPNFEFSDVEKSQHVPVQEHVPPSANVPSSVHVPENRLEHVSSVRTEATPGPSVEASTPLKIFSTTKPPKQVTKGKPKTTVTTTTPDPRLEIVPFDENEIFESETSAISKPFFWPIVIIVIWAILIIIVSLIICCRRRRRTNREFNPMYSHNYGARPLATGFAMRKGSKGFEPSYEDSIEKAARLSAEMNSYNGGRISLYGSYWTLQNSNPLPPATVATSSELLTSSSSNASPVGSGITSATSASSNNNGLTANSNPNHYNFMTNQRYNYGARY
ncbi:hypothetical protein FO519_006079 [Halicephalobus sp. NKZ332]|nr:hypothetical protein FO519_006079 [Halicephalobus sp. NKZ332]